MAPIASWMGIALLMAPPGGTLADGRTLTVDMLDAADGLSHFSGALRARGIDGQLVSCSVFLEEPVTVDETGFGAACLMRESSGKKTQVLICDDTGIGRFKLVTIGAAPGAQDDVAKFTADNCAGG